MADALKHNQEVHDTVAKMYDSKHKEIYNPREQKRIEDIITTIAKKKNPAITKVLDYGAGTGNLTMSFLNKGFHVTAVDVSQKSLDLLKGKAIEEQHIDIALIVGKTIPFPDNTFDIIATYSVLHHIPDYLYTIRDFIRVAKPGGLIYIDHEYAETYWDQNFALKEYSRLIKESSSEKIKRMVMSGEIFRPNYWKSFFIRHTYNPRYKTEGDIHVWQDDHIEWNAIRTIFAQHKCTVLQDTAYLSYHPKIPPKKYEILKKHCANMRCFIAQKTL